MDHPGDFWTVLSCAVMVAWGFYGTWRTRRLLAPARAARAITDREAAAFKSSTDHARRVHHADQLAATVAPQYTAVGRAKQWNDQVYVPVMVTLAVFTLGLAVWGVR
jgi:hypothetical protein